MKKKNTRKLINCENVLEYALQPYFGESLAIFLIEPTNISVLAQESIRAKVEDLKSVLLALGDVELMALNSRESFENNRQYLRNRQEQEDNAELRRLLEEDMTHLNHIQVQTATAREFVVGIRLKGIREREVYPYLTRVEAAIRKNGFTVHRADREDIKRLLAVYHTQNVTSEIFDNFDGERWLAAYEK